MLSSIAVMFGSFTNNLSYYSRQLSSQLGWTFPPTESDPEVSWLLREIELLDETRAAQMAAHFFQQFSLDPGSRQSLAALGHLCTRAKSHVPYHLLIGNSVADLDSHLAEKSESPVLYHIQDSQAHSVTVLKYTRAGQIAYRVLFDSQLAMREFDDVDALRATFPSNNPTVDFLASSKDSAYFRKALRTKAPGDHFGEALGRVVERVDPLSVALIEFASKEFHVLRAADLCTRELQVVSNIRPAYRLETGHWICRDSALATLYYAAGKSFASQRWFLSVETDDLRSTLLRFTQVDGPSIAMVSVGSSSFLSEQGGSTFYAGHALTILKSADSTFTLAQSFVNEYSLHDYLVAHKGERLDVQSLTQRVIEPLASLSGSSSITIETTVALKILTGVCHKRLLGMHSAMPNSFVAIAHADVRQPFDLAYIQQ